MAAKPQQNGSAQAAADASAGPTSHGNFDLINRVDIDYAPGMSVEKWQSRVTGMSVYWANFESPLLNAYVTIASEIFEDSGVPHTLEHLIFLGSELYPYKGVLDSLANRAFAQGTNAWTANDHTAYTLTTAGSDGFLRMLPVYLDHVFFPTLTASGFTTEVYHVNPKGEDAGVVFSEMQGRENTAGDLMELKTQRMLYPRSSAYRSETGGLMSALRVLTIDDIRKYHRQYYAPHNTALVVCGPLDRAQLLDSLVSVEQRLQEKKLAFGPKGPSGWKRPFVETESNVPAIIDGSKDLPDLDAADPCTGERDPKRRKATIEFPEKDESVGELQLTWLGPPLDNLVEIEALHVLSTYLTDSAVAILQQAFVERDVPACTDIHFGSSDKAGRTTLEAYFSSVPTAKLDTLDTEVIEVLQKLVEEGMDMKRMAMTIKRDRLKLLSSLETKPADAFADVLISDLLYGKRDGSSLGPALDDMRRFDALEKWTSEQWIDLVKRHYIDNPRLVVVGKPSARLADKLKTETKALEQKRREELGPAGLAKLEEELEAAKKENDKEIPPEMLSSFQIPSVKSIDWIDVGSARTGVDVALEGDASDAAATSLDAKVRAHVTSDGSEDLPYFVQWDHVNSKFTTVTLLIDTTGLAPRLRPLINLYMSVFFSLPITRADGSKLSYENVVKGLDEDTLGYEAGLGTGVGFSELIAVEVKVESANYAKAIAWLRDLLWGADFSIDRLRVSAAKIAQALPEQKRDGRTISWALLRSLAYSSELSTNQSNSLLTQIEVVPALVERLANKPESVVADFEEIRSSLMRPERLRISVAGDVLGLKRPRGDWHEHFVRQGAPQGNGTVSKVPMARDVLTDLGRSPAKKGVICALPTIESSYAVFTAKGISSFQERDTAPLAVTLAVLNAMESYLWRYIRGAGLAYGASIRSEPESRQIHFSLYRSPDSSKAFLEAKKVIESLAKGEMAIDQTTLDSAKSSLHFSVADSEGTVGQAAFESFVDTVLKGTAKGRGKRLLEECSAVTLDDVKAMLQKYVSPIFDPSTAMCAVASASSRAGEIQAALQEVGFEMERRDLPTGPEDEENKTASSDDDEESGSDSGNEEGGDAKL